MTGREGKRDRNPGPGTLPRFFSVSRVAEQVDVSTKSVRRWIESGDLPIHRIGRQIRIAEDDLLAFLRRCRE